MGEKARQFAIRKHIKLKVKYLKIQQRKARKYASLQTEFAQQVKRFKSTGKHVSRSLISKLETARSDYEKAISDHKRVSNRVVHVPYPFNYKRVS